jgi:GNAT superfamily N-acetyltransferase
MAMPDRQRLTDPGAMLSTIHELDDELRVRLRLTRPSDAPRVRAFFSGLSPETRERRFLAPLPEVDERTVRHFTFFNPRERLVVAATAPGAGVEEIVGLADIALLDTASADIGMVVDDAQQGRGIGTLLAEALATLAMQNGASQLKAEMLSNNETMLSLMRGLGPTVRAVEDGTSVAYTRLSGSQRRAA